MAYTKEPEISTHNSHRIPAIGSQTYTSNTKNWSTQRGLRYVNCFPQPKYMVGDKPDFKLLKAPPLVSEALTIGIVPATTGVINCFDNDTYLFAKDKYIYKLTSAGDVELRETHGTSDTVFQSMQKVIDYSGSGNTIVAGVLSNSGGYYAYTYNDTTDTLTTSSVVVAGSNGATLKSLFVDGYHIIGDLKTGRVYNSSPGAYTTFSLSTDYFVPEIESDGLYDIQKHRNTIACFGRASIEFFYNNANENGSPFQRHEDLTIKLGIFDQYKTISDGDDIYFLGQAPNSGVAIWRLRNFKAEKISDDYIDYLLNNISDIGANGSMLTVVLGMIDIYGDVCFTFNIRDADNNYKTFIFNEKSKIWWEWAYSDTSQLYDSYVLLYYMGGRPIYINRTFLAGGYWASGYAATGYVEESTSRVATDMSMVKVELTSSTIVFTYFSKTPDMTASVAEFYTDLFDLGTNNRKHIKYVDAVGDYGDNTVELAYTKNRDFSSWSSLIQRNPSSQGTEYPVRWTNLCNARQLAFRMRFRGTSGIAHDALEVSYNHYLN